MSLGLALSLEESMARVLQSLSSKVLKALSASPTGCLIVVGLFGQGGIYETSLSIESQVKLVLSLRRISRPFGTLSLRCAYSTPLAWSSRTKERVSS